jgi:2,4-dienoyl-CoA reductase-like NADH-dependent reductase (Old Yellow Enzyme family)
MRLPLEVARIVRDNWPADKPVFFRVSSTDGIEGGWTIEDTVALAKELKAIGIDAIDCSSGGIAGSATAARIKRTLGFQVPFAARIKAEAGLPTMAVGLILEPHQAEAILQSGQADLIAIGRQALFNPNWALHAQIALDAEQDFASWPVQYGWWLDKRQRSLSDQDAQAAVKHVAGMS